MMSTLLRGIGAVGFGSLLLLGTLGAAQPGAVDRADVASAITTTMAQQGITADGTSCPEDLVGVVGRSVRCEFSTGGQPVDAVATVTSVAGTTVNYDIHTEARPVARDLLDRRVAELIGQQAGVTIDTSSCEGDLPPQVGQSVNCTLSAAGETAGFTVTVTSIDGGLINFSVTPV
jgi:hypothetical protein